MSTERTFALERFYFGNFIRNGQPVGQPTLLARSAGITPAQAQEALTVARLKPPDVDASHPDMPSALGFYRTPHFGVLVVKAQRTPESYPQLLYLFIPDEALRWLGGNYTLFEALGHEEMRPFERPRYDLPPLMLTNPLPIPDADQIEFLYDLVMYSGDDLKNIEGLVAALVNNHPLLIVNAPPNLHQRMSFLYGLLGMLPVPARVGLTWISESDRPSPPPAQILFSSQKHEAPHALIFDWAAGKLLTPAPPDKYSKYIVAQLRLDASLVLENTANIARTAVWRAMRKESLAAALWFASRRAAIDSAVTNNQPADRETVAAILRQDPTLNEDLRLKYAQHLLAFTLALNDELHHADVLPVVASADKAVAEALYRQLQEANSQRNPLQTYDLIERWYLHVPQASVIPWWQLAHQVLHKNIEAWLTAGQVSQVITALQRLQSAPRSLQIENLVPRLIPAIQPAAAFDNDLAFALFLTAAQYLPIADFAALVDDDAWVARLPERLRQALAHLQSAPLPQASKTVLFNVVAELDAQHRMLVVGRLAELAIYRQREDLIDSRILESLLRATQSGYAWRFGGLMNYLAEQYSQPARLATLDGAVLELLPNLYFSMGRVEVGVRLLEHYQNNLFGPAKLPAFNQLIAHVFKGTTLSLESLEKIFALLEHSKIRLEPRVRAYISVLEAADWSPAYRTFGRRLTLLLFNDQELTQGLSHETLIALLDYNLALKDPVSIQEISDVLLARALAGGRRGAEIAAQIYEHMVKGLDTRKTALNSLRRYVRTADMSFAHLLPSFFDKKFPQQGLAETLQATFVMRRLLNGRDWLTYSQHLDLTQALLADIAAAYQAGRELPPKHRLRSNLDSMSGGLDEAARNALGENLDDIAHHLFNLGMQQRKRKQAAERDKALLALESAPQTGGEFLLFIGALFARRKSLDLDLRRAAMTHLFAERSATMLYAEAHTAAHFLADLSAAFPPDSPPPFTLKALLQEIDQLFSELSLYNQRQSNEALSAGAQNLAALLLLLTDNTKERVLTDKSLYQGQKVPENGLEALLWTAGYFKRQHVV